MKGIQGLMVAASVVGLAAGAQAGTPGLTGIGTIVSGTFTMYDPTGAVVGVAGVITGQLTPGANAASNLNNITSPTGFFGFKWSAHNGTLVDNGNGTYTANLPFDWGATTNIPVAALFDIDDELIGGAFTTLDGDADGIPGVAMTAGPFAGFSPHFAGIQAGLTAVPEPMSVALVGSVLTGLLGLRRRFLA